MRYIYGNPCLCTNRGFRHSSGRLCGVFISGGLIINIYFPTRENRQKLEAYRETFAAFVNEVQEVLEKFTSNTNVSWIICGADINAHFAGSGLPPRRNDDYAATCIRSFMKSFDLVSLAEKVCPTTFTFLNSRGGCPVLIPFS